MPDIAADSPTARRLCKGYGFLDVEYRMRFDTVFGDGSPPRRNAQRKINSAGSAHAYIIKLTKIDKVIHQCLSLFVFYVSFLKL